MERSYVLARKESTGRRDGNNRKGRTGASLRKGPGGNEADRSLCYCTSTVMVCVAETSLWSLFAPVTVIWCLPLVRPLNDPGKPF